MKQYRVYCSWGRSSEEVDTSHVHPQAPRPELRRRCRSADSGANRKDFSRGGFTNLRERIALLGDLLQVPIGELSLKSIAVFTLTPSASRVADSTPVEAR